MVDRIKEDWKLSCTLATSDGNGLQEGDVLDFEREDLAHFLLQINRFRSDMTKLNSRGYPEDALRVALRSGLRGRRTLMDPEKLAAVSEIIEASGFFDVVVHEPDDEVGWIEFTGRRDGVERRVRFDSALLGSAEFRSLSHNEEGLRALCSREFNLSKGETSSSYSSLEEAMETLYRSAQRNLSIQRYKGLGEMNPGQLWETTMDPERRNLLQVRIDDSISTDDIFTVLMGDQVEPRREFIQNNALSVTNLDI